MYILKTEHSFDAAHFLSGYEGKCSNLHGHRWKVIIKVKSLNLQEDKQQKGMVVDFGKLKSDLKEEVDYFDHKLIMEENTLKVETVKALKKEGFQMIELSFRPTAENLAKYFFKKMEGKGYDVKSATVFETPNNCASYEK